MAKGNQPGHRRFGNIRRLPSGRYQASYLGPDGQRRNAPDTFERKSDAERALVLIEAQLSAGQWADPERGKVRLVDYASTWIAQRPGLRPRSADKLPVAAQEAHHARSGWGTGRQAVNADDPRMACGALGRGRVGLDGGQGVSRAARCPDDGGR